MRLFGLEITKALRPAAKPPESGALVPALPRSSLWQGMWGVIRESFPGAWQRNIVHETRNNLLAFAAVYACVRLISFDISKLRPMVVEEIDGVTKELRDTPFARPLKKPNPYETRIQFFLHWIVSKLLWGNAYILKSREVNRGMVEALYVLDPQLVKPVVTLDGDVYYEVKRDPLSQIQDELLYFPAEEIIHDRFMPVFHPLVGITPLYACGGAATQGLRIQNNSEKFFENMSRPSGVLTAPGVISTETAERLKKTFESNFSGSNIGRLLVGGDGLKYEPMVIPPSDAQMIEQLKFTAEEVARAFGVPLYKIGLGAQPTFNNVAQYNQDYYSQTLQHLIEDLELLLDEGLGLTKAGYACQFELDGLLRLDQLARAEVAAKRIGAGYVAPNEERRIDGLPPVEGGDDVYMQQQMFSLASLKQRPPPAAPGAPAAPALPAPKPPEETSNAVVPETQKEAHEEAAARALADELIARFMTAAVADAP